MPGHSGPRLCSESLAITLLCLHLSREAGELLIASSTTDLETGQAGVFRQHYAISPSSGGQPLLLVSRYVMCLQQACRGRISAVQRGRAWGLHKSSSAGIILLPAHIANMQFASAFDIRCYNMLPCHHAVHISKK
jgi:hypothetical protein